MNTYIIPGDDKSRYSGRMEHSELYCSKANLPNLLEFQKTMILSNEDIRANIDDFFKGDFVNSYQLAKEKNYGTIFKNRILSGCIAFPM